LTSVPTPGTKSAIRRTMLMSRNSQSIFSKKIDGIERKMVNTKIPIPINKACLVAKWKGFPVKLSAI
jgi:hypothetical protein